MMSRLTEYLACVAIGLAIVAFVIVPIGRHVAASITNSANMIAEASHGS
jgi:hypothetical protein